MAATLIRNDGAYVQGGRGAPNPLAIAYFLLLVLLVGGGVALAFLGDPRAGEPIVRLALVPPSLPTRIAQKPASAPSAAQTVPSAVEPVTLPPALVPPNISRPIFAGRSLLADPALVEETQSGPLPRIASDGRMPMNVYAAPVPAAVPGRTRIAIVITGLGISAKATAAALAALPPQITLGFAPYSDDVQRWVGEARRQGHEVLLELPMEPYDFPDSDPGPHTLRAGVAEDANTERMVWALTRVTGYAGVTNLLGGRFLADADSLAPVMTYLARRGLLFFDNGAASHSVAPDVAERVGAPFAQSASTIDSIQTAMEIDRRLSDLETVARSRGGATGTGFLYPVTTQRVAQWAQGLAERGFVLVPASAIVSTARSQ
jgi:polysaccharide deacetylase 2 family uncharacterized protein YibQ